MRLAKSAKRFFGSWAEAVEAAGLSDKIPVKKPPRRWTSSEVVKAIQQWQAAGRSFTEIEKEKPELATAAGLRFGKLRLAVEAVGFQLKNRQWTHDNIIDEIRQRLESVQSLSTYDRANVNLASAALRYFGSWPAALVAAGVTPKLRKAGRLQWFESP